MRRMVLFVTRATQVDLTAHPEVTDLYILGKIFLYVLQNSRSLFIVETSKLPVFQQNHIARSRHKVRFIFMGCLQEFAKTNNHGQNYNRGQNGQN